MGGKEVRVRSHKHGAREPRGVSVGKDRTCGSKHGTGWAAGEGRFPPTGKNKAQGILMGGTS